MNNEVLTTTGAAQLCNVSRFTIRNWVESGKLSSAVTAGGHRRILKDDILKFMPEKTRIKNQGPLMEGDIEKTGDSNFSWKNIDDGLDSSMDHLMQKLKTCSVENLPELQDRIKALEKCKQLTGKVLLNLMKVKEIIRSENTKQCV